MSCLGCQCGWLEALRVGCSKFSNIFGIPLKVQIAEDFSTGVRPDGPEIPPVRERMHSKGPVRLTRVRTG